MTQGLEMLPAIPLPEGRLTDWHLSIRLGAVWHEAGGDAFLEVPTLRPASSLELMPYPRRMYSLRAEAILDPDCPSLSSLEDWLLHEEERPAVVLRFGDPEQASWQGLVERLSLREGRAHLYIAGGYPNADRAACRAVTEVLPPGANPLPGRLPQVFGRGWVRPVPLFELRRTRLASDLGTGDNKAFLRDIQGWPSTGTVQIQDEVLDYTDHDPETGRVGSLEHPLTRPDRRAHRQGATAVLLPASGPLRWCAADHPAVAQELRFAASQAPVGPEVSIALEPLAGTDALVVASARLPLDRSHGTVPEQTESGARWQDWQIEQDTTAADPIDAFAVRDPGRGAVLSAGFPRLRASYTAEHPDGEGRFDRVLGVRLRLEFSETPHWGGNTRLYVRISKGAWEKEVLLNRRGTIFPLSVEGDAVKPAEEKDTPPALPARHRLEDIETTGSWTMPEAALDGRFVPAAEADATSGPATLAMRFRRPPLPGPGMLQSVALKAAVHNPDQQPCTVSLLADAEGTDQLSAGFTLAAEESAILSLPLEGAGGGTLPGWDALSSLYALELPAGSGAVEVKEAWLESNWQPEHPGLPEEEVRLPLEATVGMRLEYQPVTLELDGIPGHDSWHGFLGDPLPEITVELLDPPDIPFWAVYLRAVRWEWDVLPVRSVQATGEMEALVDGRCVEPDGAACPAAVAQELLTGTAFGGLSEGDVDGGSFSAAALRAGERGFRVAAVVQGRETVGTLLERLLAETCQVLSPGGDGWALRPAPLRTEDWLPLLVPLEGAIFAPDRRELGPVRAPERALPVHLAAPAEGPAPASAARSGLLWLYKGAAILRRHLLDRAMPGRSLLAAPLDASLITALPGTVVALPRPGGETLQGELSSMQLVDGELAVEVVRCRPRRTAFASAGVYISWNPRSGALRCFMDGRLLAVLEPDGDLLLAGAMTEEPTAPPAGSGPVVYDPVAEALFLVETESGTALRLDAGGHLRVPVAVMQEQSLLPKPLTEDPIRTGEGTLLLGGLPDAPPCLVLSEHSFRIRGNVHTNRRLD